MQPKLETQLYLRRLFFFSKCSDLHKQYLLCDSHIIIIMSPLFVEGWLNPLSACFVPCSHGSLYQIQQSSFFFLMLSFSRYLCFFSLYLSLHYNFHYCVILLDMSEIFESSRCYFSFLYFHFQFRFFFITTLFSSLPWHSSFPSLYSHLKDLNFISIFLYSLPCRHSIVGFKSKAAEKLFRVA